MVGVAPDERRGRRLPQWVLGTSAADKVKSENIEEKKKHSEEEILPHASHSDPSTTKVNPGKESLLPEKEKMLESSHVLAKCRTKRRKQRAKQADVDSENKVSEKVPEKKYNRTKRVSSVSASRNKPKTKDFGFQSIDKLEIRPLSEDEDVELTVEDLMTIAEEYVQAEANKNMDQEEAAKRICEPRIRPPVMVSSRNESKDFNDARSATDDTSASYYQTSATLDISAPHKSNSSTKNIAINARATGDPAQDMLDLFLGPLLRKPSEEKKTDSVVENAAFSQDFGIQSENNTVREVIAPPVKKKSSLKDRVAMFLD